ncbi:MAG: serine protease, partial [Thermoleophilaceae bacterium]|nr:serine protease [Thermoleophilaceae bacterium]
MRIPAALSALAVLLSLAFAGSASAASCDHPASAYSTGAPADVSNPGPQAVNDPIFPDQWGLPLISAPQAWARGDRGAGAIIAVVDTGVDLNHPDLRANLIGGADVTPQKTQGCPGPQDENGHGTHVSGIAAAVTGNGIGVAGTAPEARIMPVRVLDADGSADDATVIDGIKYAADHNADVINLSVGGPQIVGETPQLNQQIADAVDYAYKKGAVVVAAAGNETLPLCSYPAAAANAVCVGAVDKRGAPSTFSNFPTGAGGSVGVRAPGGLGSGLSCEDPEDVWSTVLPEDSAECRDAANGELSGYETYAGTSMATPFVSGVAAILAAKGLSNGQILECLKATSSNGGSYDPAMGYGIVNADNAAKTCSPASTPTRPGASGGGPPAGAPG